MSQTIGASVVQAPVSGAPSVPAELVVWASADTDIGLVRSTNEDSFASRPDLGLFIVADGMGGAAAGELASRILVEEVCRAVDDGDTTWPMDTSVGSPESGARRFIAGVHRANRRINLMAREDLRKKGMGTTLAGLVLRKACAMIAHVGDSRVYRMRDGVLEALTTDHSLVNVLVARGTMSAVEAATSRRRHVITRAVGVRDNVQVDAKIVDVRAGDVFLLSSDGLHGEISHEDIVAILREHIEPASAVTALIERANEVSGRDNVTVIVARISSAP